MLTVDSKTVTEIRKESRHFSARLVFGTKKYDEIDSFTYTSHYSPQKFAVGCVPSASVQCDIRGLTASLPSKLKGQVFRLEISVGEETENYKPEWISLGEFKITEASVKDGVFSITAYDKSNFIKGDYKSNLTGNQTIAAIFDDVCSKIQESSQGFTATNADGKGYVKDTVSSPYTLNVESLKGYPLKDVLSYISAMFARNLTVNRQGLFELKAYRKPDYDLLNDDRIETPELNESDSTFGYLSAAVDSDTILTSGETDDSGVLFSCPIMTQTRLDYLQGLLATETHAVHSFRPGKVVQLLGDPRIEVGDVLPLNPVYNAEGKVISADCYIPVMSLVMKYDGGLMNEITAYDFEEDTSLSAAQRIDFAEKSAKRVTKYATAAAEFSNIISGGLGLYKTDHVDLNGAVKTYLHDQPNLSDSTYIVSFTSTGIASSNKWGGTHDTTVWTSGVDLYGNAVMKTIAANKITADLIDVTDLSALKATIGGWKIIPSDDPDSSFSGIIYPSENRADGSYTTGMGLTPKSSTVVFYAGYQSKDESYGKSGKINDTGTPWELSDGWRGRTTVYIERSGKLVAKGADISGDITATSLTLDGCKLSYDDDIGGNKPNMNLYLTKDGTISRGTIKDGTNGITISKEGLLTASNAVIYGTIYASSGTIGGFDIKSYYIVTNGKAWGTSGSLLLCPAGTSEDYPKKIGGSTSRSGWALTIGGAFGVTTEGKVFANDAYLTGEITATSGKIGGWNIFNNLLFNPSGSGNTYGTGLNASTGNDTVAFYAGYQAASSVTSGREKYKGTPWENNDGKWADRTNLYIRNNGELVAKNATISGVVTATSGDIGGWKIGTAPLLGTTAIYSTSGNYEIGMQASSNTGYVAFYVKHKTEGDKFYVKNDGTLFASKADITGTINATSGTFTGKIFADGGVFKGDICAEGGTIGGFDIKSYYIVTNGETWGTSGSLFLSSTGSAGAKSIGGSDKTVSGWVIAAGNNFGVTSAGKLYATGVCVSGTFETKESGKTTLKIDGSNIDLLEHTSQIRFKSAGGIMCNALQYNPASNYGDDVGLIIGDLGISLYVKGYMISHEQGVTGSDKRIKKDIETVNSKYESFFKLLQPVTYKYVDGTSGRIHSGFIAQQVKDSAEKSGLSTQEIAAYVEYQSGKDGFDGYKCGLRYGEFVALNTHMIQKCLKEIETLKNEISILKGVTT